jgi:hypothetical protein
MNLFEGCARLRGNVEWQKGYLSMIPWFVWLMPAAFAALGGVFAVEAVRLRRQGRACARWPVASARILGAHRDVQLVENNDDRRNGQRREQYDTFFGATVSYAYLVGGCDYRSTRLYAGRPVLSGSPKSAEATIAKYPPGALVSVFYNPANPAEAMLEPLNFENAKVALIAAIGFGGCGLLALLLMSQMSVA